VKIIEISVSGYKLLEDDFTINFLTKARVNEIDKANEVILLDQGLFLPTTTVITGKNSSGKTSLLKLINNVSELLSSGRIKYNSLDFRNEFISLKLYFYMDGEIYFYEGKFKKNSNLAISDDSFCSIFDEKLMKKRYVKSYGKNLNKICFELVKGIDSKVDDTSILYNVTVNKTFFIYTDTFALQNSISSALYLMKRSGMSNDLRLKIINLFDDNILSFDYDENSEIFDVNINGIGQKKYSVSDMNSIFSDGTKKGLMLFALSMYTLKYGGTFIIDEIENSFNKNLVENIMIIFNDKRINRKKANLIFSTHYVEIVDSLRRMDNIFIMKKKKYVSIKNLYTDYNDRVVLSRSNKFNNNSYNTLLNYEQLMKVKRGLIDEIYDSSRR